MASKNKDTEPSTARNNSMNVEGYEKLINKLNEERKQLQEELDRDYRDARRFVRAYPEEGLLGAFVGGIAIGLLLSRLTK